MAGTSKADLIRLQALADLEFFIRLIHPQRVIGSVHIELLRWWTSPSASSHQLTLLPRDHGKSAMLAYRVAWEITRNPAIRVLYVSSTANLAEKQLKYIKDIITSKAYRRYWPEMVNQDEGKRERWSLSEISVDHPKRKEEIVRDPTVFTAGLTTNVVGMHYDFGALDDIVTNETAYTEEGRDKVRTQYSLLASVEGTNARQCAVGTRYHPKDLYNDMLQMEMPVFENGETVSSVKLYEVFERQVEDAGDGSGEYLWPVQRRYDGATFGFNQEILARKRIQYIDATQFRAQYYNDPNDPSSANITRDCFQYYDRKYIRRENGKWYYKNSLINVFASVDFAFSLAKRADSTAIVVVGVDAQRNYYVLDIDRFKGDRPSEYYKHILALFTKWNFRKIRCEVNVAQDVIVNDLVDNYFRPNALSLSVDKFRPGKAQGSKEERTQNVLEPRYKNKQIWHYQGGECQTLEEEVSLQRPPHDDIKDALASVIDICIPPSGGITTGLTNRQSPNLELIHARFGGIS